MPITVTLDFQVVPSSAGHNHAAPDKALVAALSQTEATTDSNGKARFGITGRTVASLIKLKAKTNDWDTTDGSATPVESKEFNMAVGIGGLQRFFADNSFVFTSGETTLHPDNIYAQPEMISMINLFARYYFDQTADALPAVQRHRRDHQNEDPAMTRSIARHLLLAAVIARAGWAQTAGPVQLPPLTVSDTRIEASVSYDPARRVYTYDYTVVCPDTNKAPLQGIRVDMSGRTERAQLDPDLRGNARREELRGRQAQPNTTIPVGITVPDPATWLALMNRAGELGLAPGRSNAFAPGNTVTGIRIESKFPPAERRAVVMPKMDVWDDFAAQYPAGTLFTPESTEAYYHQTTTFAPFEPVESELFNGGGQSPANVNPFLRYAAPTGSRTRVPAGTTKYTVVVFYGETTIPESFRATLNGIDVRDRFQPVPGSAQAITFALDPGSNKLQLSIEGRTSSGRLATDTDTLTFLVP